MKILAVSDKVDNLIHSSRIKEKYGDVDLVFGCGDLPYSYLEFITTMLTADVAYVNGNHDGTRYKSDGTPVDRAYGCILLEDRVVNLGGLLVAGLGGSIRYNPRGSNQYTDAEMRRRIIKMVPHLIYNRTMYGRYLDILVTHSPPFGIHDEKDLPHTGFQNFLWFLDKFKPRLMLHGHIHIYRNGTITETQYNETQILNVYNKRVIELDFDWQGSPEVRY